MISILLTPLLLISLALAAPGPSSILGARSTYRRSDPSPADWAGAVWDEADETFTSVTGTFTVPTLATSANVSAAIWVGIDGYTSNDMLGVGVFFTQVPNGKPSYSAVYEWDTPQSFANFHIDAGDTIKATITMSSNSKTSAMATIENMSTNKKASNEVSGTGFTGGNAVWIIQDCQQEYLGDFGSVVFTDASASGPTSGSYSPSGAIVLNIEEDGTNVTSVTTSESGLTITYIG